MNSPQRCHQHHHESQEWLMQGSFMRPRPSRPRQIHRDNASDEVPVRDLSPHHQSDAPSTVATERMAVADPLLAQRLRRDRWASPVSRPVVSRATISLNSPFGKWCAKNPGDPLEPSQHRFIWGSPPRPKWLGEVRLGRRPYPCCLKENVVMNL